MINPLEAALNAERAFGLVRRLFWHCRLDVEFRPSETYVVTKNACYLHLDCVNRSWFVHAVGTRAFLKRLWHVNASGHASPHSEFVGPVLLRWSNTPETGSLANAPLELDPKSARRIDLGYSKASDATFFLYFPPEYTGVVSALAPGNYRVEVEVRAANSLPLRVKRRFDLTVRQGERPVITRVP